MDEPRESLKGVERRLSSQLERRDKLLKESRDVISSCSRAIIDVHGGKREEAGGELARAKRQLRSLRKVADGPLSRYLVSPETEFVEASAVFSLAGGGGIPSRESLGASPDAYLLGLLDTVGELKRLVLNSIMKGDIKKARRFFGSMEVLYNECSPLAVYDHVVNGTRRKIDVARMLVDDARGLLTEELRREQVTAAMDRVSRKLGSRA
jgi:translin